MSSLIDTVSGGILPYVYCKKVILERHTEHLTKGFSAAGIEKRSGRVDVTLRLELLQNKNELLKSNWLNDLSVGGKNLLDCMYIQALPYIHTSEVLKMKANTNTDQIYAGYPNTPPPESWLAPNVYIASSMFDDAFLPRMGINSGKAKIKGRVFSATPSDAKPINIRTSSLLGDLTKASSPHNDENTILKGVAEGKIREEVRFGKEYYIIPFEYKYKSFNPLLDADGSNENRLSLGFVFYTFLHVPQFLESIPDIDVSSDEEFYESYIIEGPVNSEIVFINGNVEKTRERFLLPGGEWWDGAVHYHGLQNPASDYVGWMVGERHIKGAEQPKVQLVSIPNTIIDDFRTHGTFPEPLDTTLGVGGETKLVGLGPNYGEQGAIATAFLSAFQKETRKYVDKLGSVTKYDNDSEFSKLYVTRDIDGSARGLFFINFHELLKNNSFLFSSFSGNAGYFTQTYELSSMLELRLYRDRVKKHPLGIRYEKYANDTFYEEPSQLIATISDQGGSSSDSKFKEVSIAAAVGGSSTRYFTFFDEEVGSSTSVGHYRYRVELDFKDGTFSFINKYLQKASRMKVQLEAYYELAMSGFTSEGGTSPKPSTALFPGAYYDANKVSKDFKKALFKSYFDPLLGRFVNQFAAAAVKEFGPSIITGQDGAWILLKNLATLFDLGHDAVHGGAVYGVHGDILKSMIHPVDGSPQGIDFYIRLYGSIIKKLQKLVGAVKINKTGSELDGVTKPNGYTFNNFFDYEVSPSKSIIYEKHTFDSPSEIFKATSNANIYIDYLSGASDLLLNKEGLRILKVDEYRDRCKLEAAKYFAGHMVKSDFHFNTGPGLGIAMTLPADIIEEPGKIIIPSAIVDPDYHDGASDHLSRTAYSYLAPSVIEVSDRRKQNKTFHFRYSVFHLLSKLWLNSVVVTTPFDPAWKNGKNNDKVFVNLVNYSMKKRDLDDADLSEADHWDENFFETHDMDEDSQDKQTLVIDSEPWKKLFSQNLSMTLHSPNHHDTFFGQAAGASDSALINDDPETPLNEEFPLKYNKNYSDAGIISKDYFVKFLNDPEQNLLKLPSGMIGRSQQLAKAKGHPNIYQSLPNSIKSFSVFNSRLPAHTGPSVTNSDIEEIYTLAAGGASSKPGIGSFIFFNFNLTSKIEVFKGTTFPKNDDDAWRLLTKSDLNSSVEGKQLFCRISLYNEAQAQNIQLPILDKYFLLQG